VSEEELKTEADLEDELAAEAAEAEAAEAEGGEAREGGEGREGGGESPTE
jgi:hypothetical protein